MPMITFPCYPAAVPRKDPETGHREAPAEVWFTVTLRGHEHLNDDPFFEGSFFFFFSLATLNARKIEIIR